MELITLGVFFFFIFNYGFLGVLYFVTMMVVLGALTSLAYEFSSNLPSNLRTRYSVYQRVGFNRQGVAVFRPVSNHFFHFAARFYAFAMEKHHERPFIVNKPMHILIGENT